MLTTNSIEAADEFGIGKTMKPAALLALISDINSLGLKTAQPRAGREPGGLLLGHDRAHFAFASLSP